MFGTNEIWCGSISFLQLRRATPAYAPTPDLKNYWLSSMKTENQSSRLPGKIREIEQNIKQFHPDWSWIVLVQTTFMDVTWWRKVQAQYQKLARWLWVSHYTHSPILVALVYGVSLVLSLVVIKSNMNSSIRTHFLSKFWYCCLSGWYFQIAAHMVFPCTPIQSLPSSKLKISRLRVTTDISILKVANMNYSRSNMTGRMYLSLTVVWKEALPY